MDFSNFVFNPNIISFRKFTNIYEMSKKIKNNKITK